MPSKSLMTWHTHCAAALDEIEAAHAAIGGTARGRRYATQQVNQAYAVLLSSQFQKYCRDLHSEVTDYLVDQLKHPPIKDILRSQLTSGRKLDSGNPNPGNLGSDFSRFRIKLWVAVLAQDGRKNTARKRRLEELNEWRNAIGHQDFTSQKLRGRTRLHLKEVRQWRITCNGLATVFDRILRDHLTTILGASPWA